MFIQAVDCGLSDCSRQHSLHLVPIPCHINGFTKQTSDCLIEGMAFEQNYSCLNSKQFNQNGFPAYLSFPLRHLSFKGMNERNSFDYDNTFGGNGWRVFCISCYINQQSLFYRKQLCNRFFLVKCYVNQCIHLTLESSVQLSHFEVYLLVFIIDRHSQAFDKDTTDGKYNRNNCWLLTIMLTKQEPT